ncbi:hypothetical protein K0U07_04150 [bacterium]|nr:hypothetical protein [bacterium]
MERFLGPMLVGDEQRIWQQFRLICTDRVESSRKEIERTKRRLSTRLAIYEGSIRRVKDIVRRVRLVLEEKSSSETAVCDWRRVIGVIARSHKYSIFVSADVSEREFVHTLSTNLHAFLVEQRAKILVDQERLVIELETLNENVKKVKQMLSSYRKQLEACQRQKEEIVSFIFDCFMEK